MNKQDDIMLATIITTLAEHTEPIPESYIYLAMEMDLPKWESFRRLLLGLELATFKSNAIQLTTLGRKLGERIELAIQEKMKGKE